MVSVCLSIEWAWVSGQQWQETVEGWKPMMWMYRQIRVALIQIIEQEQSDKCVIQGVTAVSELFTVAYPVKAAQFHGWSKQKNCDRLLASLKRKAVDLIITKPWTLKDFLELRAELEQCFRWRQHPLSYTCPWVPVLGCEENLYFEHWNSRPHPPIQAIRSE